MREIYEWLRWHYMRLRYPPRPMTGFWDGLTLEQQQRVLEKRSDI